MEKTIFRIKTEGADKNEYAWDLLTLDGENPRNTVYFMLKEDAPSYSQLEQIEEAIQKGEWQQMTIEQSRNDISDFSLDMHIYSE